MTETENMQYAGILERALTTDRPAEGVIDFVEVVQRDDSEWQINISVSWKPNIRYSVQKYDIREVRLYKSVASALWHIVDAYDYYGAITVKPFEGFKIKARF
jgi:hypothetical protein